MLNGYETNKVKRKIKNDVISLSFFVVICVNG